jgi:hypothetical protein
MEQGSIMHDHVSPQEMAMTNADVEVDMPLHVAVTTS